MNVLIIDDEASLRRTLRIALESMDHQVIEAVNRSQALEMLSHRHFDLAFLDLRLAQDQGLEVLPEVLRFGAEYRMVIYSLLLIVLMLTRPSGLMGSSEITRWRFWSSTTAR